MSSANDWGQTFSPTYPAQPVAVRIGDGSALIRALSVLNQSDGTVNVYPDSTGQGQVTWTVPPLAAITVPVDSSPGLAVSFPGCSTGRVRIVAIDEYLAAAASQLTPATAPTYPFVALILPGDTQWVNGSPKYGYNMSGRLMTFVTLTDTPADVQAGLTSQVPAGVSLAYITSGSFCGPIPVYTTCALDTAINASDGFGNTAVILPPNELVSFATPQVLGRADAPLGSQWRPRAAVLNNDSPTVNYQPYAIMLAGYFQ